VFQTTEEADYVMVAGSDQRAHQKIVKLGVRNGDRVQIVSGLGPDEKVIGSGGYGLPDKSQIKLQETPASKDPASADKAGAADDSSKPDKSGKE
jgi:multidrug efflux system membrane fusion protein